MNEPFLIKYCLRTKANIVVKVVRWVITNKSPKEEDGINDVNGISKLNKVSVILTNTGSGPYFIAIEAKQSQSLASLSA